MVQTLTVWSNGTAEINTGANFLLCDGILFTDALQSKLDAIESAIFAAGISQLHVEKDTFRQFEHAVSGGEVAANDFGSTVSPEDFSWIMQHVDAEYPAWLAASQSPQEESAESEPEIL